MGIMADEIRHVQKIVNSMLFDENGYKFNAGTAIFENAVDL